LGAVFTHESYSSVVAVVAAERVCPILTAGVRKRTALAWIAAARSGSPDSRQVHNRQCAHRATPGS